ncbi:hypothetical protein K440DRAFT_663717 [Wilcoxina mikolae CBS 423.85]|nr:hypothetical protein K440DRAFT_663717 [Wilcoxina mikolae CBS 423.85]
MDIDRNHRILVPLRIPEPPPVRRRRHNLDEAFESTKYPAYTPIPHDEPFRESRTRAIAHSSAPGHIRDFRKKRSDDHEYIGFLMEEPNIHDPLAGPRHPGDKDSMPQEHYIHQQPPIQFRRGASMGGYAYDDSYPHSHVQKKGDLPVQFRRNTSRSRSRNSSYNEREPYIYDLPPAQSGRNTPRFHYGLESYIYDEPYIYDLPPAQDRRNTSGRRSPVDYYDREPDIHNLPPAEEYGRGISANRSRRYFYESEPYIHSLPPVQESGRETARALEDESRENKKYNDNLVETLDDVSATLDEVAKEIKIAGGSRRGKSGHRFGLARRLDEISEKLRRL